MILGISSWHSGALSPTMTARVCVGTRASSTVASSRRKRPARMRVTPVDSQLIQVSRRPSWRSRMARGLAVGSTCAWAGRCRVCSIMNWPDMTAWEVWSE